MYYLILVLKCPSESPFCKKRLIGNVSNLTQEKRFKSYDINIKNVPIIPQEEKLLRTLSLGNSLGSVFY